MISNFIYFFYAIIIKIFGIKHSNNIYILILILILSLIFTASIIKLKNKTFIYMFIFMSIYMFIYCAGQSIETTKIIVNSNTTIAGRYIFIPSAILLTIIFSYAYYLYKNRNIFCLLIAILILIISFNFIFNKAENMMIIRNIEWNEKSKFYDKNGINELKIKINPEGWDINIPSNNIIDK